MSRSIKRILVTGGAGFMGSTFVHYLLNNVKELEKVVTLDSLTYAGNLENLKGALEDPRHEFKRGDIRSSPLVEELIRVHHLEAIIHFAAESHVDRSIENPKIFYQTNVEGTISLLEVLRRFPQIHFHHVSTDEVFGSLKKGKFFETSPYCPNSPYAASKAASDHFVRAYALTYGLSVTLSHSSNNYGPRQYREKLIPLMISHCLSKKPLPIYGEGQNIRDWLYVEDHAEAIWIIATRGKRGESYNIGGGSEWCNLDLIHLLIEKVAQIQDEPAKSYLDLITFVKDRPGHDFRYALSTQKLEAELGWRPKYSFELGMDKTIRWYAEKK